MCDSGELSQELTQGMATFEVVDEILERNASTSKAGRTAHNVRVAHDHLFSHSLYSI